MGKTIQLKDKDNNELYPITLFNNVRDENGNSFQSFLENKANKADIPTKTSQLNNDSNFLTQHQDISGKADKTELEKKQDTLVSGENIKTINNLPILGKGNINIEGGGGVVQNTHEINDILYDLNYITNEEITGCYKFDESGYYLLTPAYLYKVSNNFELIYKFHVGNTSQRTEAGLDRNVLTKIGNNIFIAKCLGSDLVLMYNEMTQEQTILDNPKNLLHYGSVYSYNNKIIYAHRYQNKDIYIYNQYGILEKTIDNTHDVLKITNENIAFTFDGYLFDLDTYTFSEKPLDVSANPLSYGWLFSNMNYVTYAKYGFLISDKLGSTSYTFDNETNSSYILFAINKDRQGTIIYNTQGKYICSYPWGITNRTARYCNKEISCISRWIKRINKYNDNILILMTDNILKIENLKKYGTI